MRDELQQKLYDKFPKIFAQKDLSPAETLMCWGIECGDGWYDLIHDVCHYAQFQTDHNKAPQMVAVQVKEKFGTLRFYYNGGDDRTSGAVSFAELISGRTCEVCGKPGERSNTGWITVRCEEHRAKTYSVNVD